VRNAGKCKSKTTRATPRKTKATTTAKTKAKTLIRWRWVVSSWPFRLALLPVLASCWSTLKTLWCVRIPKNGFCPQRRPTTLSESDRALNCLWARAGMSDVPSSDPYAEGLKRHWPEIGLTQLTTRDFGISKLDTHPTSFAHTRRWPTAIASASSSSVRLITPSVPRCSAT